MASWLISHLSSPPLSHHTSEGAIGGERKSWQPWQQRNDWRRSVFESCQSFQRTRGPACRVWTVFTWCQEVTGKPSDFSNNCACKLIQTVSPVISLHCICIINSLFPFEYILFTSLHNWSLFSAVLFVTGRNATLKFYSTRKYFNIVYQSCEYLTEHNPEIILFFQSHFSFYLFFNRRIVMCTVWFVVDSVFVCLSRETFSNTPFFVSHVSHSSQGAH